MPLKKNKESKAAEILMEEQSEVINPPKNKKCPKLSGRRQRKPRGDKLGTLELCDDGFATDEEEETNNGEYESCHHFQIQETTVHDHEQKEHTNLRKKRKEHLKNVEVNMEVDNHISQNDNSGKVELVKGETVKGETLNIHEEDKKQHIKGRVTKKKTADNPAKEEVSNLNIEVEPVVVIENTAKVEKVENAAVSQQGTRTTGRTRKGQNMEMNSTKEKTDDSKPKSNKRTQKNKDEGKDKNDGPNLQEQNPGEMESVKEESSNNDMEEKNQHSGKGRQTKKKTADSPDKVQISSLNVKVVETESKAKLEKVEDAAINQQGTRTTGRTRKGQNMEEMNKCSMEDSKPKSNKRTQRRNDDGKDEDLGLNVQEKNPGEVERAKVESSNNDIEEKKQHSGKGREAKKKTADNPEKVQISRLNVAVEPVVENKSKDNVINVENAAANQQETRKTTGKTRKGQNLEETNICSTKEETTDGKPKSNKRTQKKNDEEMDKNAGLNLLEGNHGKIEQVNTEPLNIEEKKQHSGKGREIKKKRADSPKKVQISSSKLEEEPVENGSKDIVEEVEDATTNQQETSKTTGRTRNGQNTEEMNICNNKEKTQVTKPKSNKRTQKRNADGKDENAGLNLTEGNLEIDQAKAETLKIQEKKQHSGKGRETKKKTAESPENVQISSLKVEVLVEPLKNGSQDKVEKIEDAVASQQETRSTGRKRKGQNMAEMNMCSTKEEMADSKPKLNKRTHKKNDEEKDKNAGSDLQEGNPGEMEPVKEDSLKIDEKQKKEQREAKKKIADSPEKEEVSSLNVKVEPVVENRSKENIDDATANQQEIRKTTGRKRKGPNMEEMNTLSTKEETTDSKPKPNKRTLKRKDEEKDENETSKSESVTKPTSEISHGDTCEKFVGAHVSIAGGLYNSVLEAADMKAKAFGLFLKSQRKWECKPLDKNDAIKFKETCQEYGFLPEYILPHGSYLMNCGSPDESTLQKSREALVDELQRCEMLGLTLFNFHPGSSCGKISTEKCLETIAESINYAHSKTNTVVTVIENMCCQGHTVGGKFEELKSIIDKVTDKSRIGVCLDTCHAFAAGYDLSTEDGFQKTISEFDTIIGFKYLKGMHINDSKGELGCHLDRHENIGKGKIGKEGFRRIMNCPQLNNIPMILETPCSENDTYAKEVKILYGMCNT